MLANGPMLRRFKRRVVFETLEYRLLLDGDGPINDQRPCPLEEPSLPGAEARAAHAVNCFGLDLYQRLQHENGNLLFSPLSLSTALTMFYAGAAGETAAQMEQALYLGAEPGIHNSFAALLEFYDADANDAGFSVDLANAMWPQAGIPLHDVFVQTVRADYQGEALSLDYANLQEAKDTINAWVTKKTLGKIEDLIQKLDPQTLMVVTNSLYFQSIWESQFDPDETNGEGFFKLADGSFVTIPIMNINADFAVADFDGFRALELPFRDNRASMVLVLPHSRTGAGDLTRHDLAQVHSWLDGPRESRGMFVTLPKFTTTVSVQLEDLLADMGLDRAFKDADFSNMTPLPLAIQQVRHKAFIEVKEDGAEAAAATVIGGGECFSGDTPILTANGEKPIEHLRAGDIVLARDEFNVTGKVEPKVIEETFCHEGETVDLHLHERVIRVTQRHPFFVKDRGWTSVQDLHRGDQVAVDLRRWMTVDDIVKSGRVEPVYNFRVADHHTYFVGAESWGFAVWVHNCSAGQCFNVDRPFHFLIRDNANSALLFMGRVTDPTQIENTLEPTGHAERLVGDSNGDGIFNSADLVHVFRAGKYEDSIPGNATFDEGDWNGDGDFTSRDFVFAFQSNNYTSAARPIPNIADRLFERYEREKLKSAAFIS